MLAYFKPLLISLSYLHLDSVFFNFKYGGVETTDTFVSKTITNMFIIFIYTGWQDNINHGPCMLMRLQQ